MFFFAVSSLFAFYVTFFYFLGEEKISFIFLGKKKVSIISIIRENFLLTEVMFKAHTENTLNTRVLFREGCLLFQSEEEELIIIFLLAYPNIQLTALLCLCLIRV